MQSPSIDSILHSTFAQSYLFQLRQRRNPVLPLRNDSDLSIQPMG